MLRISWKHIVVASITTTLLSAPDVNGATVCFPEGNGHVVLNRGELGWPGLLGGGFYNVIVRGTLSDVGGAFINGVTVYLQQGPGCATALEVTVPDMDSGRTRADALGTTPVVDVITESRGGSGSSFAHRLFTSGTSGLKPIPAPDFEHTNMGGFYVGDLGKEWGAGAVIWDALWEDGAHYSPHRYRFRFYTWRAGQLVLLQTVETPQKVDPDPNEAARAMGFPFRDQTEPSLMPWAAVRP